MRSPCFLFALVLLSLASPAAAQAPDPGAEDARERAYVDGLRREDPAIADRYVALRDARTTAMTDLRRVRERFSAMPPALRPGLVGEMRQAERTYAERSLALLDFIDARDRGTLARYEEESARLRRRLDERAPIRAELEKLLRGN